jgi:Zn-dependent M28 family amino/carboxypeptidase
MRFLLAFFLLITPVFAQAPADFRGHVEKLATFDGRKAGTDECENAAKYLEGTLTKYGLKVTSQSFEYTGYKTRNLIATIGKGPEYIVVGAHYDGQGSKHPGADDNASGVAGVLELARAFKRVPTWRSLIFILFTAEEDGLIGSQFYVEHPITDIKKHLFMVNLDMIGTLSNAKLDGKKSGVAELLIPLYAKYPFARDITLQTLNDDSDNYSFRKKNVQAVFIHTGVHARYHTPKDTPASLNYEGMVKIHQYVEELIRTLSAVNLPNLSITKNLETYKYVP